MDYVQGGQVHLTAKYEAPPLEFSLSRVAQTKQGKAKFAPFTLHCPSCYVQLGTTCRFGPNHELVQARGEEGAPASGTEQRVRSPGARQEALSTGNHQASLPTHL